MLLFLTASNCLIVVVLLNSILPGFQQEAKPNYCGWGTPNDTRPRPAVHLCNSSAGLGAIARELNTIFFNINETGKKPVLRGMVGTLNKATILKREHWSCPAF